MPSTPTVMVSSTFYDLTQIRQDLNVFLANELGYEPLLSEHKSFPIDPGLDTVENCRRRVEEQADILILVVGTRYGSIDDKTDKSITNIEYLTAKAKSIPIYTFVDERIIHMLPVWKTNPDADYSEVVDTPRLFEFVDSIRSVDKAWVLSFDTAQDIVAALRSQFAYLVHKLLKLNTMLEGSPLTSHLPEFGPRSLRLALEKPYLWEYLLLFQVWQERVDKLSQDVEDYRAGFTIGVSEDVVPDAAVDWLQTRMHELQNMTQSFTRLVNSEVPKAFGPAGEPPDVVRILWAARKFGEILEFALKWSQRVRCARVHAPFDESARIVSEFMDDLVDQLCLFPGSNIERLVEARATAATGGTQTLEMIFTLRLSHVERFDAALAEAAERYGGGLG